MARFDVFANPDRIERLQVPYFLDVQSDHIQRLHTRVVVPLWAVAAFPHRLERLHPELVVTGQQVVMDTPALGAAPTKLLRKVIANLGNHQLQIQDALDALFGAY